MISTPINEQLGIKYHIFQGGMAWQQASAMQADLALLPL